MAIGIPLTDEREERYAQARAKLVPSRLAAVQAGWGSAHNAARIESRPRVQERIRDLRYHDEVDIAWQRRLLREELTRIALFRMPELFEEDKHGKRSLRPISDWTDDERAAVAEIWLDSDGGDRVKAHSKLSAIELLMKLDGLVDPDVMVSVSQQTAVGVAATDADRARALAAFFGRTKVKVG